jgi:hypothetical protein
MSYNARTMGQAIPRNYRVEWPAYGETVTFASKSAALKQARDWAYEDKALVLVWDFACGSYLARFDGRNGAEFCDGCGDLSNTLITVEADNPDRVRDLCVACRCEPTDSRVKY